MGIDAHCSDDQLFALSDVLHPTSLSKFDFIETHEKINIDKRLKRNFIQQDKWRTCAHTDTNQSVSVGLLDRTHRRHRRHRISSIRRFFFDRHRARWVVGIARRQLLVSFPFHSTILKPKSFHDEFVSLSRATLVDLPDFDLCFTQHQWGRHFETLEETDLREARSTVEIYFRFGEIFVLSELLFQFQ